MSGSCHFTTTPIASLDLATRFFAVIYRGCEAREYDFHENDDGRRRIGHYNDHWLHPMDIEGTKWTYSRRYGDDVDAAQIVNAVLHNPPV